MNIENPTAFTEKEISAAKETRDEIIKGDVPELKSIYMAGEICMWDELIKILCTCGKGINGGTVYCPVHNRNNLLKLMEEKSTSEK